MQRPNSTLITNRARAHSALWVFVLAGGVVLTALLSSWTWREALQRDQERFATMVEQFRQELETRVERYELGLLHLAEWFVENELASKAEWENRIERMNLRVNFPGVTELCYAPAINETNLARWTGRMPAHWPPLDEAHFWTFPVFYQATQPPGVPAVWGRKLRDELSILESTFYVRGTSRFLSTGRIQIATGSSEQPLAGFVLLTPVHRKELPPPSGMNKPEYHDWPKDRAEQRQMSMVGLVAGTVCMEALLDSIFGGRHLEIDCEIYAGKVVDAHRMNRLSQPPLEAGRSALYFRMEIPWYYNRWNIVASPNRLFEQHSHRSRTWGVLGAGLILTLALAWTVRTQERARLSAEAWAHSLETARAELRIAHSERLQLGRNLHDGALQSIYASLLGLRRAGRAVHADPSSAARLIDGVVNDLEGTMREIRGFLTSTRQETISSENLPAVLQGFVNAFNRLEQSQVVLDFDPAISIQLTAEQAEELMHIVKEGVSNAHRHGKASHIHVRFQRQQHAICVSVEDNGSGFEPKQVLMEGHGLQYMNERAAICRGRLEIVSRPGGPTRLSVLIPDISSHTELS
ncbi:MAG: ATP-binding protein [Verrucomicrobiota bacterium]